MRARTCVSVFAVCLGALCSYLPLPLLLPLPAQVCIGLDFMHRECQLIHTDLKPENVLTRLHLPPVPRRKRHHGKDDGDDEDGAKGGAGGTAHNGGAHGDGQGSTLMDLLTPEEKAVRCHLNVVRAL